MARKGTVSISFVVGEGKDGLKKLTLDAAGLRRVMAESVKVTERLGKSVYRVAATSTIIKATSDAVGQLTSALNDLTGESLEFGKAMKAANTMAGKDGAGFKQLKGEVADLAKEIPIARDQLANGLYQTISNGVPEDNWIDFLKTSARSAVGGLADINKVVGVTSTLIKNYGLEWSAAADIQDKMQLTAKNGVTSFEQLAQALPRVTGNAATLGVSIDELMGTFATLTGVSGNTAEVSTQLAAIFTALVKPSSEAAEMADKMGIRFDAAAIKAAGGFRNFLQQLDGSVKAYAQANGALEQEIYGRLFGSAEALRALIPLQGELADKFTANVANMANSAGTMDAAYADMSTTGEAVNQMLRNQWATVIDVISGFTSAGQPYINFSAGLLSTASNATILITTFKRLNLAQLHVVKSTKLASVVASTWKTVAAFVTGANTKAGISATAAAGGFTAMGMALRGLLIASGVGIAITALTTVVDYLVRAIDDATESTNKFLDAQEQAKRDAEQLKRLRQQEKSILENTRSALELNIAKLKEFNGTKEQEKKLVGEMNDAYGDTMGYFSSVADWYNTLVANSEAYCRQMVIEARTRSLADQIAQKEQEIRGITHDETGKRRMYSTVRDTRRKAVETGRNPLNGELITQYTWEEVVGSSDLDKANARVSKLNDEIRDLKKQLSGAAKEAAQIDFKVKGSDTRPDIKPVGAGIGGSSKPAGGGTYKEPVLRESATQLQDIEENIAYYEARLKTATKTTAAEYNKRKSYWEGEAKAIRAAGLETATAGEMWRVRFSSIGEIEEEIEKVNRAMKDAPFDELDGLRERKKYLEDLLDFHKGIREEAEKTKAVWHDQAKNIQEIDENISILRDKLKTASLEEAKGLNQQIAAHTKLRETFENAGMPGASRFDSFKSGYSGIKDMTGAVESLTDALKGNGTAWDKAAAGIDAFIRVYDGVNSVIGIIQALTGVTGLQTEAKTAEAAATTAAVTAQGSAAGMAETAAAAQIPVIAANKTAAASYMELAAASYFAAHASIPFAGFGIASGFVASAKSIVAAIGAVPFANGGIVSGPTIGLIGEYTGASNNPEVVAPLDKLRGLLDTGDDRVGKVEFKVKGEYLIGVLNRTNKRIRRT